MRESEGAHWGERESSRLFSRLPRRFLAAGVVVAADFRLPRVSRSLVGGLEGGGRAVRSFLLSMPSLAGVVLEVRASIRRPQNSAFNLEGAPRSSIVSLAVGQAPASTRVSCSLRGPSSDCDRRLLWQPAPSQIWVCHQSSGGTSNVLHVRYHGFCFARVAVGMEPLPPILLFAALQVSSL